MTRRWNPLPGLLVVGVLLAGGCGEGEPESTTPQPLVVSREPVIRVPRQVVAIDLDGDGVESVEIDASESLDVDGRIVDFRWSNGLDDLAFTATHTAEFSVGKHVVTLTVTDDDGLSDVQSMVVRVLKSYEGTETSPVIDVWSGSLIEIDEGTAQRWVNILGNVRDPQGVASLVWSLNGGPVEGLSLGPNDRRLVREGDFNVDILRERLEPGENTVELRATDNLGEVTTALVRVDAGDTPVAPFPIEIDWSTIDTLDGLIEVIDGNWQIEDGHAVIGPDAQGYDRLLGIGDRDWTDFDVRTTVTPELLGTDLGFASTTPGFGFLLRWNGHNDSVAPGSQPQQGFRPDGGLTPTPYGGFPFYTFEEEAGVFEMQDDRGGIPTKDDSLQVELGVTYNLRAQVQSITGGAVYRAKLWPGGSPEPAGWAVSYVAGSGDFEPFSGSLVLVTHELAARWGNVTITDVPAADELTDEQVAALSAAES